MATLGACVDVFGADTPGESDCVTLLDCSINHVALVAGDHDRSLGQVLRQLVLPLFDFLEAVLVSHVVHDQGALAVAVVAHVQSVVPLLASRVPNREAHLRFAVNRDFLLVEGGVDGRLLLLAELVLAVLDGEG